jgi:hypothetical protein
MGFSQSRTFSTTVRENAWGIEVLTKFSPHASRLRLRLDSGRRLGNLLVVNNKKQVLVDQPLEWLRMVTIRGAADKSDNVTVLDLGADASAKLPDGIIFEGGGATGKKAVVDTLTLHGTSPDAIDPQKSNVASSPVKL